MTSQVPVRLQRKRTRGYNLQAASREINGLECVCVTRPTKWGNPYEVSRYGLGLSLKLFRNTVNGVWSPSLLDGQSDELCDAAYAAHNVFLKRMGTHPLEIIQTELGGKNLACWCPLSRACHSEILLELANKSPA